MTNDLTRDDLVERLDEYAGLARSDGVLDESDCLCEAARRIEALQAKVRDLDNVLEDKRRLTRELDVALNGESAARQASLCDLLSQVRNGRVPLADRRVEKEREACASLVAPTTKAWWVRVQQDYDAMRAWKSGGEIGFPPHSDLGTCEDYIASAIRARSNDAQPDDLSTARSAAPSPIAQERDVLAEMRACCEHCGGTGDVHRMDGEWLGFCDCQYGTNLRAQRSANDVTRSVLAALMTCLDRENPWDAEHASEVSAIMDMARRYLSASPSPPVQTGAAVSVPEGWQLVPVELTVEMTEAAAWLAWPKSLQSAWSSLLSASPSPPVQERQEVGGGEDYRSMTYQTRLRAQHDRERFDFVLGKAPKMISGKGKYYLLNFIGLKEAYEAAKKDCPIAADAICAQIWDRVTDMQTLAWLAKDFEAELHREPQPVGGGE